MAGKEQGEGSGEVGEELACGDGGRGRTLRVIELWNH